MTKRKKRLVQRGLAALAAAGTVMGASAPPMAAASAAVWQSSARFGQTKRGGFILDNNEWHGGA
ncbi:hypothetical protein GHK86_20010, partial [Acidimicrobiaceae bacterium USS-CC1]|nr:hypothetical protein [Acidiferrimicrobium australe]